MGVLPNYDHERFCQEVHRRVLLREKLATARTAAYREHIYTGEGASDDDLAPNARRLAGQKHIRDRIKDLAEFAAKLAGIDSSWAMVELKAFAQGEADFTQEEIKEVANGKGELVFAERKVKIRAYDPIAAHRLMAEIAGWKAPAKIAPTTPEGKALMEFTDEDRARALAVFLAKNNQPSAV